jgi:hypothetical protein
MRAKAHKGDSVFLLYGIVVFAAQQLKADG